METKGKPGSHQNEQTCLLMLTNHDITKIAVSSLCAEAGELSHIWVETWRSEMRSGDADEPPCLVFNPQSTLKKKSVRSSKAEKRLSQQTEV